MGRGADPLQTTPRVFEHYRLAIPGENVGGCLYCIFKHIQANKRFMQEEENTRCQGRHGLL